MSFEETDEELSCIARASQHEAELGHHEREPDDEGPPREPHAA